MRRYLYTFTRQDIFKEYQLVQTSHATFKLGFMMAKQGEACIDDPDNTYFTCVGVRNLDALEAVEQILVAFDFEYEVFVEPDLNGGEKTSIAVYPVDEDKKGVLQAFNLLKF